MIRYGDITVMIHIEPIPGSERDVLPFAEVRYKDEAPVQVHLGDLANDNGSEDPHAEVRLMYLDRSRSSPQVVLTYYWDGAHCCTVTKIASVDEKGHWDVINAGVLDGGGHQFLDILGDGGIALVSVDNSFLYAFGCYACSSAPTRIRRLEGSSLHDVTTSSEYQPFLRQRLRAMEAEAGKDRDTLQSQGYLGGWVAAKALVGEFQDAWKKMRSSYHPDPDWSIQECVRPVSLRDCADDDKREVGFPQGLAALLLEQGYITATTKRQLDVTPKPAKASDRASEQAPMSACQASSDTVRTLILRKVMNARDVDAFMDLVALENDFTVNARDDSINKITCAVTYRLQLKRLIGRLAEAGSMRTANALSVLARRVGQPILSARAGFTVQPTSKPGQTWVQLLH